jgi:hypothetical protein
MVFPGTRLEGLRFSCLRKSKPFALAGCFKLCLAHIAQYYHCFLVAFVQIGVLNKLKFAANFLCDLVAQLDRALAF